MSVLNEVIHQPLRLRLMAALVALQPDGQVGFTSLRDLLNLTDGNLGTHLRKLEEAGYIKVTKTFVARKPQTYICATPLGRHAFAEHVTALEGILQAGKQTDHQP